MYLSMPQMAPTLWLMNMIIIMMIIITISSFMFFNKNNMMLKEDKLSILVNWKW